MKAKVKHFVAAGLFAACAATAVAGVSMLGRHTVFADGGQSGASTAGYYYHNLVTSDNQEYVLAKKFYKAFGEMYESGDFKDGKIEYCITDKQIVTSDQIKAWVEGGDLTVPKAFSAARDAFLTDNPQIFYIDFYKLTISAGRSNGVYSAYIDTGREENAYFENGFTTEKEVNGAVAKFNEKVNVIVNEALAAQAKDKYSEKDVFLARYVNKYLNANIKYDSDAYENRNNISYIAAANINTAYGGIVEGKAVCGGYSTAYKAVMDKLGIPCITVNGYSKQRYSGDNPNDNVYHMWNYVWLADPDETSAQTLSYADGTDGEWYSVDCTWNKAILNASADAQQHINDGRISSSGYELQYPALSSHIYGSTGSAYGLQQSVDYEESDTVDEDGNAVVKTVVTVSYNGKSAIKLLEEDGLHIAYRAYGMINGKMAWDKWCSVEMARQFMGIDVNDSISRWYDDGNQTRFIENTSVYNYQFAVFEEAPDVNAWGSNIYYRYSDDLVNTIKAVEMGEIEVNETYGTYTPAPYILSSKPTHQVEQVISDSMSMSGEDTGKMKEDSAQIYEITYDEELHILDSNKPIDIEFTSDHPNAKDYARFIEIESENNPGTMVKVELVQRPKNSVDPTLVYNTLRFKFAPSLMYEHNREGYFISFTNVGSAKIVSRYVGGVLKEVTSDKVPNPVYYSFGRLYRACPACFNYDGRLWVECCAQPTLVSNTDLSVDNFTDENGSTFSENERSQMMLVAEKAETATVDTMLDEISGNDNFNVKKDEIKTSETYDISLQICGKYPKIPDGSYVKIGLGFPEGYGPDDEGVTFKLYHRKHDPKTDTYSIEEVPCVVTRFGIVATVTSFSPYMVAVVDAEKATSDKTILATVDGKGGKLTVEDGKIQTVKEGGSYAYTIKPDDGYQLFTVTLNGKNVTDKVKDNKLNLTYAELANNNEVEIKYIANGAVKRVVSNNLVTPAKVVVSADGASSFKVGEVISTPDYLKIPKDNKNVAIIVSVIVAVVVVGAAAVLVTLLIKKNRAAEVAAPSGKTAPKGKEAPAKSAPAAKPATTVKSATATATAARPSGIAGSAAKPAAPATKSSGIAGSAAKPAATVKPATAPAAKPTATAAKPSGIAGSAAKPAATVKPATAPAAKPAAPATKSSGIAGSAAKPAATVKPATAPAAKPATAKPTTAVKPTTTGKTTPTGKK